METIIQNGYKLIYNTEYDKEDGFYYTVKEVKTNKTRMACTGYNTIEEALEGGQNTALKYWNNYMYVSKDKKGANEYMTMYNLFESKTGKAF